MADYSAYLTEENLPGVEEAWAGMDRSDLCKRITDLEPQSVIEFCCGTGWIPLNLSSKIDYLGLDANQGCIDLAQAKNPQRKFFCTDIRAFSPPPFDLALAFSCLKHFPLSEWDDIYSRVLRAGKQTLTTIYLGGEDREDAGYDYPHVSVSKERMERVVEENGHRIVEIFTLPPLNKEPEPLVLTEARWQI